MKRPVLITILVIILLLLLSGGGIWYTKTRLQLPKSSPTATPTQNDYESKPVSGYVNLTPTLTKTSNGTYNLALTLNPQGEVGLATLTLQVTLTPTGGKLSSLGSAPTVNPQFQGGGWTFPFNNLTTTPEGNVVLKTSLVYASPESYTLAEPVTFVTIPLNIPSGTKNLTLTIDPAVSKIYTKQSQLIHYTSAGSPVTMQVPL